MKFKQLLKIDLGVYVLTDLHPQDWHEAIDYYRPVPSSLPPYAPIQGPNLWPSPSLYPTFRPTFEPYISALLNLGDAMMRAMSLALHPSPPREDLFLPFLRAPFWVMRILGYPPLSPIAAAAGGVSCGEHSDYGCTTFLLADSTKGALQVLAKDGSWINADPVDGAYVVNIGDMVEVWTNGLWKSTRHRVVHKGSGYRVSVPFFFEPDWDALYVLFCLFSSHPPPLLQNMYYFANFLNPHEVLSPSTSA